MATAPPPAPPPVTTTAIATVVRLQLAPRIVIYPTDIIILTATRLACFVPLNIL